MTSLSIVIPAFNEEDGIRQVLDRVLAMRLQLAAAGIQDLEVIVVDDGSRDRTPELVTQLKGAGVRLVRHARNRGYGAALKTGFAAASGEWVGFLDADGTYPPEYLPVLCQAAMAEDADLVIGSRMAGAESEMPAVRRLGNILFANLVTLMSAQHVSDSASGMRIFRKSVLERVYPLPDGLNLTPVMSTRALHEQMKVIEVPIPYRERIGRSKLSVFRDGARFAQSIVWTALSYNPVRPLGLLGVAALAMAALIGIGLVGSRIRGITTIGPLGVFALFSALVLAVAGISVFALGASFNYFVSLFHRRPIRQGLFGRPILKRRLESHFGLAGAVLLLAGVLLAAVTLGLGLRGWDTARLWLYYLSSASLALIGIQLIVAWIQVQVLDALKVREQLVAGDMLGSGVLGEPALDRRAGLGEVVTEAAQAASL